MRILVIGGTGFIGPYVVRGLVNAGHSVTVCHRGQTEADLPTEVEHLHHPTLAYGDRSCFAELADEFRRVAPEVVLDTTNYIERDAQMLMNTFRGIARRVVVLSSIDVYRAYGRVHYTEPGPPDPMPLMEDSPLREKLFHGRGESLRSPDDPARWFDDVDKILVERVVLNDPVLPGTVLRCPAVYGPGDGMHRLFIYVKRMADQRPAFLMDEGSARWRWSYGYVENVAHAIVLAISDERSIGRIYNVAEAEALTTAEWIKRIGKAAGWEGKVIVVTKDQLPDHLKPGIDTDQHWAVDTTRIRQELGYTEPVPQAVALEQTVAWELANPPKEIDPKYFDYADEDALLAKLAQGD